MSDEEVICTFMEPRPRLRKDGQFPANAPLHPNSFRWWTHRAMTSPFLFPVRLTLDALHEVEARLTDEQWGAYREWFMVDHQMDRHRVPFGTYLLHASSEQKIKALAEVLRAALKGDGR